MTLAVTGYSIVLALHVMGAIAAFGVLFAYPFLLVAVRRPDVRSAGMHEALGNVHQRLVNPAATVVLLAGVYLAIDASVFDRLWVSVPLVIILVLFGLVGGYFVPQEKRLAALAGEPGDAYEQLSRQVVAAAVFAAALVLVATFFMVVKP